MTTTKTATKLLTFAFAAVLLTACANKDKDTGMMTTEGELTTTERTEVTSVDDYNQAPTGPAAGTQQDLVVNVGDRVFFDYDQHDLTLEARGQVERQAEWLKLYPNLTATIEGHADERGTREYNLALAERRAQAVHNYLTALGVSASRLSTISYGKERPAVVGANPGSWAQNRRGVLVVN